MAFEVELFERKLNQYVGTLQVLFKNEGRQAAHDRKASVERIAVRDPITNSEVPKAKTQKDELRETKKVYSTPVEALKEAERQNLMQAPGPDITFMNEDQRKALRVSRLR